MVLVLIQMWMLAPLIKNPMTMMMMVLSINEYNIEIQVLFKVFQMFSRTFQAMINFQELFSLCKLYLCSNVKEQRPRPAPYWLKLTTRNRYTFRGDKSQNCFASLHSSR